MGTAVGFAAAQVAGSLAGMAKDALAAGINFNAMKEQAQTAFTTMLGSGQEARRFLDDLQSFAAKTPFEFPELVTAAQRMKAMGFEAGAVIPTLTSIGDAVAGLGGGAETINRVVTAFGQIQARGKAAAQEMMQLTEAGIPAWKYLADAIGVSVPEAMKLVERGAVDAQTTISAVRSGMDRDFGGMMAQQSQTWNGMVSTVKDNTRIVIGEAVKPMFEVLKKGLEQSMTWFEDHKAEVIGTAREIGGAMANLGELVLSTASAIAELNRQLSIFGGISGSLDKLMPFFGLAAQGPSNSRSLWDSIKGMFDIEGNLGFGPSALAGSAPITGASIEAGDFSRAGTGDPMAWLRDYNNARANDAAAGLIDPTVSKAEQIRRQLAFDAEIAKAEADITTQRAAGSAAASAVSEAEKILEDQRRESARAIENIQNTFIAEQIKAYYDGGQAQLDAVKKTQESMMVEVQARAAELQQKWGLDFPDALTKAFEMVKSGIDNITESAKKLQESTMSYIQSLGARNVRFANPGVLEAIAGPAGINTSFGAPASNFGSLEQLAAMTGLPSFDGGGYMPYDGLAMLHAGERVLTPQQQSGGLTINVTVTGDSYGVDDLGDKVIAAINRAIRRDGNVFLPGAVMS